MNDKVLLQVESDLRKIARCVTLTADALDLCRTIEASDLALHAWAEVIEVQAQELEGIATVILREIDTVEVEHGRADGSSSIAGLS